MFRYDSNLDIPYRTKFHRTKYFVGQNFRHKAEISTILSDFAWLLYWNIGQYFRQTKYFVWQNIRHQAEISTILSDFYLTFVLKYWTKFLTEKIFRRTKFRHFCPTNFCPIRYISLKMWLVEAKREVKFLVEKIGS